MATPFDDYLASCRYLLASSPTKCVVIGNEAADLDSMASSMAYAYLLATTRCKTAIPIMPIPRGDFKLRTEAVYVFKKAEINLNDLIFLDEVNLEHLLANDGKLVLVDHNRLYRGSKYGSKVCAIIDHHPDEGFYNKARLRLIEPAGSTATIVTREINRISPALLDQKLTTLLLGTILLDTVNLDSLAKRVTPADEEAVRILRPLFTGDPEIYFNRIQHEKFNTKALSSSDLLRKDLKQWKLGDITCGIGSVLISIKDWAQRDDKLADAFVDFSLKRKLDLLLTMNAYTDPDFRRDLIIYAPHREVHDTLIRQLREKGLKLRQISPASLLEPSSGTISYFHQENSDVSRKKLQPILSRIWAG